MLQFQTEPPKVMKTDVARALVPALVPAAPTLLSAPLYNSVSNRAVFYPYRAATKGSGS